MLVSCSLVSVLVLAPPEVQVVPAAPTVELLRVPDAGIQPQVVVSADGTVHLLYFQGDADAGDLFYVARAKTERDFTAPTRVNSQSGSACAIGNDRGGKLAVGRGGAVHVVWNGSERTHAKGEEERAPFLYARRSAGATTFDAQRNLMTRSSTLDGGGDVIADEKGRVLAIWHALPVDVKEHSETSRRVFVATSTDDGTTFAGENAVSAANSGTCGCCALEAGLLRGGEIAILFRAATDSTDRGTHLLRSKDGGATFVETTLDHWKIEMCPMTTAAIASSSDANAIAWQDREEIKWARPSESAATESVALGGQHAGVRKYPALAIDAQRRTLVAWTEGMGWKKGGRAQWAIFDANGAPIEGATGGADGVPAWSLVGAFAKPEGGFVVVY